MCCLLEYDLISFIVYACYNMNECAIILFDVVQINILLRNRFVCMYVVCCMYFFICVCNSFVHVCMYEYFSSIHCMLFSLIMFDVSRSYLCEEFCTMLWTYLDLSSPIGCTHSLLYSRPLSMNLVALSAMYVRRRYYHVVEVAAMGAVTRGR